MGNCVPESMYSYAYKGKVSSTLALLQADSWDRIIPYKLQSGAAVGTAAAIEQFIFKLRIYSRDVLFRSLHTLRTLRSVHCVHCVHLRKLRTRTGVRIYFALGTPVE